MIITEKESRLAQILHWCISVRVKKKSTAKNLTWSNPLFKQRLKKMLVTAADTH